MSLQEQINSGLTLAIKTKNEKAKNVLRVVIGELNRKIEKEGKILSDESVVKTIQKMITDLKIVNTKESNDEILILQIYVPKELTKEEIQIIVTELFRNNPNEHLALKSGNKAMLGFFIKLIKEGASGAVDMKIVNEILNKK